MSVYIYLISGIVYRQELENLGCNWVFQSIVIWVWQIGFEMSLSIQQNCLRSLSA